MLLTCVDQLSGLLAWSWSLNKSWIEWSTTNFIFGPRPDSTPKWLKQWPQVWMQCSYWALRNILSPRSVAAWWQVCDFLSSKFIWHLKWVPSYELKYPLCRKQLNKSHHFWNSFGCSNWISKTEPRTALSLFGLNVWTLNFSFGYSTLDPCISLTRVNQTWTL